MADLSQQLNAKVTLTSVDYDFFNKITLEEFNVNDQKGDSMLYVEKLNLKFNLFKLMQNRFVCYEVVLDGLDAQLKIDKQNKFNLQFLIDALRTKDKKESKMVYNLDDVRIFNSALRFDNENFPAKANGLDARHLNLTDINASLAITLIKKDSVAVKINTLSAKEKCGFVLKDFSAALHANKNITTIDELELLLPNSELKLNPIVLKYDSLPNLKYLVNNARFDIQLNPSTVNVADIAPAFPQFKDVKGYVKMSLQIKGTYSNLRVKNIDIVYDDALNFKGDFEIAGLPNIGESFIYAKIKEIKTSRSRLQDLIAKTTGKPFLLPEQLDRLGVMTFKGNISGFFSNLVAYGELKTNVGKISTDLLLNVSSDYSTVNYSGDLSATDFELSKLMNTDKLGNISFHLVSKGEIQQKGKIYAEVSGDISSFTLQNYAYKNIKLEGVLDQKIFDGKVELDDPNAKLVFEGLVDASKALPSMNFALNVKALNLNKLNLIKKYPDLFLSFNMNTNFIGEEIEKTDAEILIDSVFVANGQKEFYTNKIYITSDISPKGSLLTLNSDIVKGRVEGDYAVLNLINSLKKFANLYLPSLKLPVVNKRKTNPNNFSYTFSDFKLNQLLAVLDLDYTIDPTTSFVGFYNDVDKQFKSELIIPTFTRAKDTFTDFRLGFASADNNTLQVSLSSTMNKLTTFAFKSSITNDNIGLELDWNKMKSFSGKISSTANIYREGDVLNAKLELMPSQVFFRDSAWNVMPCVLTTDFKSYVINDFSLENDQQHIRINGIASKSLDDILEIDLKSVELGEVLTLLRVRQPKLAANVTGTMQLRSVLKERLFDLNLVANNFYLNDALCGDLKVNGNYDQDKKAIWATGICINQLNPRDTVFKVNGGYMHEKDSLDFKFEVRSLPVKMMRRYLQSTIQDIDGKGRGYLRLFGNRKHVYFYSDLMVDNGSFNVDYLKTKYTFNDTICVRPNGVELKSFYIYDEDDNQGVVNGVLTHKNFRNMKFNFDINVKNLLTLNTKVKDNPDIYGKAFTTGLVNISGTSMDVLFSMKLRTNQDTKIVIPMVSSAIATDQSFVRFVKKEDATSRHNRRSEINPNDNKTNIRVHMQMDVTPEAEVVLITDPVGGDMLRAIGSGNLTYDYDRFGDMKFYGTYEIDEGKYIFTLQQVVRKNFDVKRGGTIRWSGDPYKAIIDLDAKHTVPAVSLVNILDESQLEGVDKTTVPVNCLLNLTGDLMQPTIKFDLELPSDVELQMRVKNVINTEEMMNREMLSLLVIGQFYRPDYMQNNAGFGTNEVFSLVTTTMSGQINNWLSQINDNLNVGMILQSEPTNTSGREYGMALGYQPNNRLYINGNLGYTNDVSASSTNTSSTSSFIGDVDIEYKLNRSGKLRAKAYTHTNNNYYYSKSGFTTQGLGLMFREDFNSWKYLWRYYWKKKNVDVDSIDVVK